MNNESNNKIIELNGFQNIDDWLETLIFLNYVCDNEKETRSKIAKSVFIIMNMPNKPFDFFSAQLCDKQIKKMTFVDIKDIYNRVINQYFNGAIPTKEEMKNFKYCLYYKELFED